MHGDYVVKYAILCINQLPITGVNLGSDTNILRPDPTDTEMLRQCIYAERKYSHVYTLSLSTGNKCKIHHKSSINKYKTTCKRDQ